MNFSESETDFDETQPTTEELLELVAKQEAIIEELTSILEQSEQSTICSSSETENDDYHDKLKQKLGKLQKICDENNEKILKLTVGRGVF
uniref:Uncharacterized protein n=1 Tax=Panagrolaimus sp. JU765 TaxID=591449 RepID=A0AC34Q1B3_9BILA